MTLEDAKKEISDRFPDFAKSLNVYPIYAYPDDETPAWLGTTDGNLFLLDDVSIEHYKISSIAQIRR